MPEHQIEKTEDAFIEQCRGFKQEAKVIYDLAMSHKNASGSYKHLINSLAFPLNFSILSADFPDNMSEEDRLLDYEGAVHFVALLRRYFKLFEDFPEFKKKELENGLGYFPGLLDEITKAEKLIGAYEKRLKAENGD
jgi:hypothetical protein